MAIMQENETKLQKGISVSSNEEVYFALLDLVKEKAFKQRKEKALLYLSRVPYRKAFVKQPYQLRHLR